MKRRAIFAAMTTLALTGCGDDGVYTLYRSSLVPGVTRIHVATFDARDGSDYNRENCDLAATLYSGQDGVRTKFWCEAGRFQAELIVPACDGANCNAEIEKQPSIAPLKQALAACKLDGIKLYKPIYDASEQRENLEMKDFVQTCMEARAYLFLVEDERCGIGSWSLAECYKARTLPPLPPGFVVIDEN